MSDWHVNYADTCFHYPVPTKIEGEPTHATLTTLQKELQANASSVDSNLGGGNHGYLGLVLSDPDYANIPGTTPSVAPTYPTPFVILATATAVEALSVREQHKESIQRHHKCDNVKKTFCKYFSFNYFYKM